MENKEEFKFGEFTKKHPIISMAIGLVVILALVIMTIYSNHPIFMWFLIGSACFLFLSFVIAIKERTGESWFWFICSLIWLGFWCGVSVSEAEYMFERHYDKITIKSDTVMVSKRISCTQVQNDAERIVTDYIYDVYKLYSLFTPNMYYIKDTIVNSYTLKGSSRLTNDTLHIENLTCGDTLTKVDKKPYEDKNFSLIRTRKTFIDSNWQLTTDTSYTNKSPNIKDWELNKIFNNVKAKWIYDRYVNKYVVKMIDENKSDTLDTENLALEFLNKICKGKSTIAGKLVYTEYDACKSSNSVSTIKVIGRSICGHSNVKLIYDFGSTATAPYNCLGESNVEWFY